MLVSAVRYRTSGKHAYTQLSRNALLCCIVLCCVVLCCVVLFCVGWGGVVMCCVVLWCVMPLVCFVLYVCMYVCCELCAVMYVYV